MQSLRRMKIVKKRNRIAPILEERDKPAREQSKAGSGNPFRDGLPDHISIDITDLIAI